MPTLPNRSRHFPVLSKKTAAGADAVNAILSITCHSIPS